MNGTAPRHADFHGSGADSVLPQRPLLTTPPRLQPPDVAREQRQRLGAQPWLGLGGLLLTAVVFFALALGTASIATALLILGPISTFALPAVAMIAFWWNDWPGSRLSVPWTGLIDTAAFIAAAIALTIAGQAIVERPDARAVAAVLVVGMLFEGWPAARLPPAPGRLLTLVLTALVAIALDRVLASYANGVTWMRATSDDWITTAALSFLGVGIIAHVAVGLRWPFALKSR
jgi:hypothetical protein